MPQPNYNRLLYFIAGVILVTLAIQVYWNYKNYQAGKRQLMNDVQISLDLALDNYYVDLADKNTIGFALKKNSLDSDALMDSLIKRMDLSNNGIKGLDSLSTDRISKVKVFKGSEVDNMDTLFGNFNIPKNQKKNAIRYFLNNDAKDSINDLVKLTSRIIISITEDSLNTKSLTGYIDEQLVQKNMDIPFGFTFKTIKGVEQEVNATLKSSKSLTVVSKSAYLPKKSEFTLYYNDIAHIVLRRNLFGILLSTVLITAVIACLLFLLKIINRQKQLAEIKNDLIGNMTHEFKTPIATIGVTLEGLQNFNTENDPVKTKNYLNTSTLQLDKLNTMVEKLLETATLDGGALKLEKEPIDLDGMLKTLVEKHEALAPQKIFKLQMKQQTPLYADAFHIENAINNILDNAVKYGGHEITVYAFAKAEQAEINISDNGTSLTRAQAEQLFEKFYRVPQGNTHNVRGFGIGLFYTKTMIEKHGGTIKIDLDGKTTFKITLPNGL